MPETPDSALNRSATKSIVRQTSGISRVGDDAIAVLEVRLTAIVREVAEVAGEMARGDERSTLLPRDLEDGLRQVLQDGGSGPVSPDPEAIFEAMQRSSTDQVAELIRRVLAWVQDQKESRPGS